MTTPTRRPLMACGHTAQGIDSLTGEPVCVICVGLEPGAIKPASWDPKLSGRTARCDYCKRTTLSHTGLAFFEYLGPGSRDAIERCRCGYYRVAHEPHPDPMRTHITDHAFEARGASEHDRYYCGCRGWD